MLNLDKDLLIEDLFRQLPKLECFWVKGDLTTFEEVEILVGCEIKPHDVYYYLTEKYGIFGDQYFLRVFEYEFIRNIEGSSELTCYTKIERAN